MNRLLKIARSAMPGTGVQFRASAYGTQGLRQFLRDVISMANAAFDGPRLIFTGIETDAKGNRQMNPVSRDDFSGKPSYQSLVADFIEPPIRIRYKPISVDGKRVGVYEIANCGDKPYMMRADFSEKLRRGDAYIRVDDSAVKMGRRQLQELFEAKFRESVSVENVEIGFVGEIMHKSMKLDTVDLSQMPSALAAAKLEQLLQMRSKFANSNSDTVMARLTHARLFGSDNPYKDRSPQDLMEEMAQIRRQHRYEDEHFLYEQNGQDVQLALLNQGDQVIQNASLTLVMPNHNSFYVASSLPRTLRDEKWVARPATETSLYPAVTLKDDSVNVSNTLGDVSTDAPVHVFETPLRICVGTELKNRKLEIRYSLFGSNLRKPARGRLRLLF
jgi:hypothetical protein